MLGLDRLLKGFAMTKGRKSPAENSDFYVAGIGASAGDITALQSLLPALPAKPNLALVVVQHLMPGQPSRLVDVLVKWPKMPVRQAADGDSPEPDCMYVAAPDDVLTIEQGIFRTRPVEGGDRRPGIDTIDAFLESLAVDRREKAIAIILSGTGSDGAAGAIRVRQEGGMVFAQDPITGMHDGMPVAVIGRGITDHIGLPDNSWPAAQDRTAGRLPIRRGQTRRAKRSMRSSGSSGEKRGSILAATKRRRSYGVSSSAWTSGAPGHSRITKHCFGTTRRSLKPWSVESRYM
jgi:hypothetical protein